MSIQAGFGPPEIQHYLGYVDFIRVLGLRSLARSRLPHAQTAFLERAWGFLGRNFNTIFIPQDKPTLESGIEASMALTRHIERRLPQLHQDLLRRQPAERLRDQLEQWGFEGPVERTLYLSGLPSYGGAQSKFSITFGGVSFDARWIQTHLVEGCAELTLWPEPSVSYEEVVQALLSLHGLRSERCTFKHDLPQAPNLVIEKSVVGSGPPILVWTDRSGFLHAVRDLREVGRVTIQMSPGTYELSAGFNIHANLRLSGGGGTSSAVNVSTVGLHVKSNTRAGSRVEISNIRFVAACAEGSRPPQRLPLPEKRNRKRAAGSSFDADIDGLAYGLQRLQLDEHTLASFAHRSDRPRENYGMQPDALMTLSGGAFWLHHCSFEGGLVCIHVKETHDICKVEQCDLKNAIHAGILVKSTAVIVNNLLVNNGVGVHVMSSVVSSLRMVQIRSNRFHSVRKHDVDDGERMLASGEGIRVCNQASAHISENVMSGLNRGICLAHAHTVSVEQNLMEDCSSVALLVHAPYRQIIIRDNTLRLNVWGVLCRSVWGPGSFDGMSVLQPKQTGALSIVGNSMTKSSLAAIVISGGGFGGCLTVKIKDNHLTANRSGVIVSGPALRKVLRRTSEFPYNAVLEGNTIEGSDTAAVMIQRGAAAHVCDNNVKHNGRGVSVQDSMSYACCARVENNVFEGNNGWALRFAIMAYTGRSQHAKEEDLQFEMQAVPVDEQANIVLFRLIPKIISSNKGRGVTKGAIQKTVRTIEGMGCDGLIKLATDHGYLDRYLRSYGLKLRTGSLTEDRHSLVWRNRFIQSGRSYGRGAWAWRVDTTAQAPHAMGNIDQNGDEVKPHIPRPEIQVSDSQPRWSTKEGRPVFTARPPKPRHGRERFGIEDFFNRDRY